MAAVTSALVAACPGLSAAPPSAALESVVAHLLLSTGAVDVLASEVSGLFTAPAALPALAVEDATQGLLTLSLPRLSKR
jgi:hypothetical protein